MLDVNKSKVKYFEIKVPLSPLPQISKEKIATRTLSLGSLKLD